MLNTLAILLPLCTIAVAKDAPNPQAVFAHEMAHCWGWTHADHGVSATMNKSYQAPKPSLPWRLLGDYPNTHAYRFDTGRTVARLYCDGNAYGCQWGGLSPKGE